MLDYGKVPAPHMLKGVKRWIDYGTTDPASLLWAVITNNLKEALWRADDINAQLIREWVMFFHWEAPGHCHGSVKIAKDWKASGGLVGQKKIIDAAKAGS